MYSGCQRDVIDAPEGCRSGVAPRPANPIRLGRGGKMTCGWETGRRPTSVNVRVIVCCLANSGGGPAARALVATRSRVSEFNVLPEIPDVEVGVAVSHGQKFLAFVCC